MKKIISIAALFLTITTYSQENPWEKKQEANPWIQNDTSVISKETLSTTSDSILSTIDFKQKGFDETKANGAFAAGVITCSIFSVFGTVPSMLSVAVPNHQQISASDRLQQEYPSVTPEQIKEYKRGVTSKRAKRTFYGCLTGIVTNAGIIFTIICIELRNI